MNIFDIVLYASKQPCEKAKKRRFFELWFLILYLRLTFFWLCFVNIPILTLVCLHLLLKLLELSLPFLNFLSDSLSMFLPVHSIFKFQRSLILSLVFLNFMDNLGHYNYIFDLVLAIILASGRILVERACLRHQVSVWAENEMNVTKLHFEWLWK